MKMSLRLAAEQFANAEYDDVGHLNRLKVCRKFAAFLQLALLTTAHIPHVPVTRSFLAAINVLY